MRMWMVDVETLCRKHLLGEHMECHMFVGTLNKGTSIVGYIENGLLEVHNLRSRHDELVQEMVRRGYTHNSPLPIFDEIKIGNINREESLRVLLSRCESCRGRSEL